MTCRKETWWPNPYYLHGVNDSIVGNDQKNWSRQDGALISAPSPFERTHSQHMWYFQTKIISKIQSMGRSVQKKKASLGVHLVDNTLYLVCFSVSASASTQLSSVPGFPGAKQCFGTSTDHFRLASFPRFASTDHFQLASFPRFPFASLFPFASNGKRCHQ